MKLLTFSHSKQSTNMLDLYRRSCLEKNSNSFEYLYLTRQKKYGYPEIYPKNVLEKYMSWNIICSNRVV